MPTLSLERPPTPIAVVQDIIVLTESSLSRRSTLIEALRLIFSRSPPQSDTAPPLFAPSSLLPAPLPHASLQSSPTPFWRFAHEVYCPGNEDGLLVDDDFLRREHIYVTTPPPQNTWRTRHLMTSGPIHNVVFENRLPWPRSLCIGSPVFVSFFYYRSRRSRNLFSPFRRFRVVP